MLIKNEVKAYCVLTVLCLILLIALNLFTAGLGTTSSVSQKNLFSEVSSSRLNVSPIAGLVAFFYLVFAGFGIVNLSMFFINKIRSRPSLEAAGTFNPIVLSRKEIWKLLFLIIYFYLAINLAAIGFIRAENVNPDYYFGYVIGLNLIINFAIIFLILRSIPLKSLGLKFNRKYFIYTIRIYSAILIVIYLIAMIMHLAGKTADSPSSYSNAAGILLALENKWLLAIFILEICFIAPLSEELIFRGFFYNLMRKRFGYFTAGVITSLLFAFLHRTFFGFFVIFAISMAICYLYEKTNSIVTAIAFHSLHNSLGVILILTVKQLTTG